MVLYKTVIVIISFIGLNLLSIILSYLRSIHSNITSKRLEDIEYHRKSLEILNRIADDQWEIFQNK